MSADSSSVNEGSKHAHLFVFSGTTKAGMEKCDKERQARIIYEMSKNSAFYKRQVDQDEKVDKKVNDMKTKLTNMSQKDILLSEHIAYERINEIEKKRCFDKICCVLDMAMWKIHCCSVVVVAEFKLLYRLAWY